MKIHKRFLMACIAALMLLGSISGTGYFTPAAAQVIRPQVPVDPEVLKSLQAGESADYVIVMAEQADLIAAYGIKDWDERGWYVYNTLKETAARTQKHAVAQLQRQGVRFQSSFAANVIYVYAGTQQSLNAVLDLAEVASIRAPVTVTLDPVAERFLQPAGPVQPQSELQSELQAEPEWGIAYTGAPEFWTEFDRKGEGIIVANIDTGVQYNHPALAASYRCVGGNIGDARCWKDVTDVPSQVPYDANSHGTHTMGIMVGSDDPSLWYKVGMAPGASWIACRAFDTNTTTSDKLIACADWILAPDGNPANRPHIVNNSWGDDEHSTFYQPSVQAWRAAGIFPVFSAGNDGTPTTCSEIGSPADYPESFTVASHDSTGTIASNSSKGPVSFGGDLNYKPNITAPGVAIWSSIPTDSWFTLSGTSMAAPHVSGAVALLWSCNDYLKGNVSLTAALLQGGAASSPEGTCDSILTGGNYTYGYGILDVLKAGQMGCGLAPIVYLPVIQR